MEATVRVRTLAGFVAGFAGALMVVVVLWAMSADAAPGDTDTTFVPITACRLVDTRPTDQVGPRSTALGTEETYTVQMQDASTECAGKVPAAATGLSMNVTAVQTTAQTFLTIWDQGPWPGTSSLNPVPGPPVPNAVTTKLSPGDTFEVYNDAGSTHLIVDVGGYYTDVSLDEITARLIALESAGADQSVLDRVESLEATVSALETENATQASKIMVLETKAASMSVVDSGATVRFSGVNVQVVSGSGTTDGVVNGRGNFIVGYNENDDTVGELEDQRTGSHNLVVGERHSYTSYGGLVVGFDNTVSGTNASVSGGSENLASGPAASVSGGRFNAASGYRASVSGGSGNEASGSRSSVSGGGQNRAIGPTTAVSGGTRNEASTSGASVSGGADNSASGSASSVSGGEFNSASSLNSSVSGGFFNTASGDGSSVSGGGSNSAGGLRSSVSGGESNAATNDFAVVGGGFSNEASGPRAVVSGGADNIASGSKSTVGGGDTRTSFSTFDWRAGSLFEDQ